MIKDHYKPNPIHRHKKHFNSFILFTLYLWSLSFKGEKYKNQSQNPQVTAVMIVFRTKIGFIHAQFRCFPGNKQKQARSATNCFLVFFFEGSFRNYVDQISPNFNHLPSSIGKLRTVCSFLETHVLAMWYLLRELGRLTILMFCSPVRFLSCNIFLLPLHLFSM